MQKDKPVYVTMPSLAPIEEFTEILKRAWNSGILTHNGPLVQELEKKVNKYLGLNSTVAVTNGTIALQMAIKALGLKGEIITTPFSWIATSSSIRWEGCEPVFVDINPDTLNIDAAKIEEAITHRTTAIMAVHVFSNPCDIESIEKIAKRHNLKVIYDAAHSFGVNYKGKSTMAYGDISTTSWHATKIFNTGEGGACFSEDRDLIEKLRRIRFFGHDNNKDIVEDGCNGKMTEVHAALGLSNIPYINDVIAYRKAIYEAYFDGLKNIDYLSFQKFDPSEYNYSYMPLIFNTEERMLTTLKELSMQNIFARRYFFPSLNTIKAVKAYSKMEFSEDIASRIICLPSHNQLSLKQVQDIIGIIKHC